MPPPPDSEVNPYAPPVSEVANPLVDKEAPMKRPASVKWAMGVFIVLLVGGCLGIGGFIVANGWAAFMDLHRTDPIAVGQSASRLLTFVAVIAGGRPIAYWAGAIVLGWWVFLLSRALWYYPWPLNEITPAMIGGTIGISTSVFLAFLFYRFTFGRPSRLYYRVAKP
ncbi:MAG: hypothetical protein U0984_05490 [Prosthecobacter sp.]|nr:hypothetical protein [Prosthecobacter sp.]